MNVWKKIAESPTLDKGHKKKHFWEKFQDRVNKTFHDVNVIIAWSLLVSLDDDKKKALAGKSKDMQGLKQHVLPGTSMMNAISLMISTLILSYLISLKISTLILSYLTHCRPKKGYHQPHCCVSSYSIDYWCMLGNGR